MTGHPDNETRALRDTAREFADAVRTEFDKRGGTFAAFEHNGVIVVVGRGTRCTETLRTLVRSTWKGKVQRPRKRARAVGAVGGGEGEA